MCGVLVVVLGAMRVWCGVPECDLWYGKLGVMCGMVGLVVMWCGFT